MFFHSHPHKPFLYKGVKKIIMGTLPPPRFCTRDFKANDVDMNYGSKDNLLWKIIEKIYNINLLYDPSKKAVDQRKAFLKQTQIGICDIVASCEREKIDASDIGMSNIILRDILNYLSIYNKIDTIIFMGGYCKNSPEYFFRQILKKNNIKYIHRSKKEHYFIYEDRVITTFNVTSPSNAANRAIGANPRYKENKAKDTSYSTLDFRVSEYRKVFR